MEDGKGKLRIRAFINDMQASVYGENILNKSKYPTVLSSEAHKDHPVTGWERNFTNTS